MGLRNPFTTRQRPRPVFGPRYAVINLSKVGLRYFRIFLRISSSSRATLLERFVRHPNIGWIFDGEGWFNFGIGIWARDNSEMNDLSAAIRDSLGPKDKVIYQSELTSLYGFGNRPVHSKAEAMPIIDSTLAPTELSPLELDYLKLIALDDTLPTDELARILGTTPDTIATMRESFEKRGIVVGTQDRLNYDGYYFKVVVNSASRTTPDAADALWERLWDDPACIYMAKGNGVYDLEFEAVLPTKRAILKYLGAFSDYKTAILTENLYTNLYPLSKMANLLDIEHAFANQEGTVIDFRTSKLWYLRRSSADAYLNIYKNRAYFEAMEKAELDLFDQVCSYVTESHPASSYSIIDVGSGDGLKSRVFIEKLGEQQIKAYYPVDIQPVELAVAMKAHAAGSYAKLPTLLDFENLGARFPLHLAPHEHQIAVFFGGTYGNFDHHAINAYLASMLDESSTILVSMPVRSTDKTDEQITASYANRETENMAFGPLEQVGFSKESFARNPRFPELYIHTQIQDGRNVCFFVLDKDVTMGNRTFHEGTTFKMLSSWKPTLEEFRAALELDFTVERMFSNEGMAIASIVAKAV